jgi:SAM-dependent methyltransferase
MEEFMPKNITHTLPYADLEFLKAEIGMSGLPEQDRGTILGVFARPAFLEFLLAEEGEAIAGAIETLRRPAADKTPVFENLRKLSMGVWLEQCSSFAIDEQGELQINIDDDGVSFSDDFKRHLESKKLDGVTSTFYRQAALRQIERYVLLKANGLFDAGFHPRRIADIGSGTGIAAVMMREAHPQALIDMYEPGLVSEKTRSIARARNIHLREDFFSAAGEDEPYDLIMLNFVLEHDKAQSRELLRQALTKLAPGGKIAIGVPNFEAFHRANELDKGLSDRDPATRLSAHDSLSGHRVIFRVEDLVELIHEVQQEAGSDHPVYAQTILPRPYSFNQMLGRTRSDTALYDMEREGHLRGQEGMGSVTAITIGGTKPAYNTPVTGGPRPVFDALALA